MSVWLTQLGHTQRKRAVPAWAQRNWRDAELRAQNTVVVLSPVDVFVTHVQ
jgi:hypothetical protein